jgi:uncharacterized lipoprotein YddW (UPF0748 family)
VNTRPPLRTSLHGTVVGLLCLWLVLHIGAGAASAEGLESRAILDETFSWLTPEEADQTLSRLQSSGFNVFIPVVWHGRGAAWPSRLAPPEPQWEKKGNREHGDPLRYLTAKAHQMGIEVHPWFTVSLRLRDFLPEFYDEGTPLKAFNVHVPGFRRYMMDLMLEVARNYDVDGIHMDYIRSMGVCVSAFCVEDYRKKTRRELLSDVKEKEGSAGWRSIAEWNAGAVEDIVQTFGKEAKALKPDLLVSVSSHAGLSILLYQGTDSIRWANMGWIDVIYHMEYAEPGRIRWQLLKKALDDLKDPSKLVLMIGNYDKSPFMKDRVSPRDADTVAGLIETSRRYGQEGNGVALYEYPYLSDSQIEKLRSGPFRESTRPAWKSRQQSR